MHNNTIKMHKNGGYVSAFKARRNDNSDDTLWFEGQKVEFDHKMLWFESDFEAKNRVENDVF